MEVDNTEPEAPKEEQEQKEQEKPEKAPAKEKAEKKAPEKKAPPKHEGSMAQFVDQLLEKGGTWDEIKKKVFAENEKRGLNQFRTLGAIRQHANFRLKTGKLKVEITENGVKHV